LTCLLDSDEVALSVPVYLEVLTGATRENRSHLRRVLSALPVFYPAKETWSRIEEWIERAADHGHRFGILDLLSSRRSPPIGALRSGPCTSISNGWRASSSSSSSSGRARTIGR